MAELVAMLLAAECDGALCGAVADAPNDRCAAAIVATRGFMRCAVAARCAALRARSRCARSALRCIRSSASRRAVSTACLRAVCDLVESLD